MPLDNKEIPIILKVKNWSISNFLKFLLQRKDFSYNIAIEKYCWNRELLEQHILKVTGKPTRIQLKEDAKTQEQ